MVALSRPARPLLPLASSFAIVLLVTGGGPVAVPSAHSDRPGAAVPNGRWTEAVASLPVFIGPSTRVADPDVPLTLEAQTSGGLPPFEYLWQSPQWGVNHGANWTVVLPPDGTATVSLEVSDAGSEWGIANATFVAGPSLSLGLSVPPGPWDDGATLPVNATATGGLPPYRLAWNLTDGGGSGTEPVEGPASVFLPVEANGTGSRWIEASLTDSLGGLARAALQLGPIFSRPQVEVTLVPGTAEAGQWVSLDAVVVGGAPPITWSVTPVGELSRASSDSGTIGPSDPLRWTAVPTVPGNLTLTFSVVDGSGQTSSATLELPVLAPVTSSLEPSVPAVTNGSSFGLSGEVTGGLPPYRFRLTVGSNVSVAGNLSMDSRVNWTLGAFTTGLLPATLTVWDALGYSSNVSLTIPVLPSGSQGIAEPNGGGGWGDFAAGGMAVALVSLGSLAGFLWWRRSLRRRSDGRPDSSGALAPLERLLGPSDGVDSQTLEQLAGDQEGLDPEQLTALLDRGLRAGKVRHLSEPDGDRYVWVRSLASSPGPGAPGSTDPLREDL